MPSSKDSGVAPTPSAPRIRTFAAAIAAALCLLPGPLPAQTGGRLREPVPLDVVTSIHGHNGRSPINLSPDGLWLAHTVMTDETVPRDTIGFIYAATGFSLAEGDARMEATLTHATTGETIRLGGPASASWAPVWSPDGSRVAFYSDEGGEAGLWIWERETRVASRVPGLIVRPLMGFEGPRWSADGRRLLVKVLPDGMSVAEANAREARGPGASHFPPVGPGEPSVVVRRVVPGGVEATSERAAPEPAGGAMDFRAVDLVLVDLGTRRVTRVAERLPISYYAWSPDGRLVAYTVTKGAEPNSQQTLYDLVVHDLRAGTDRRLVTNARMVQSF